MTTNLNKATNFIYEQEMVLLKTYIYEKKLENGGAKYLTLFSLLPTKEYRQDITVYRNKSGKSLTTGTDGVYIKTNGSQTDLIQTSDRVSLKFYQQHLEANGWKFMKTVAGTFGMDLEIARQLAWHEIIKIKKGGDKKKKEKVEAILHYCDVVENKNDDGIDITDPLNKIRELVNNL